MMDRNRMQTREERASKGRKGIATHKHMKNGEAATRAAKRARRYTIPRHKKTMGEIGMSYSQSSQDHFQKATSPARRGPVANEGLDRTELGATIILRPTSLPARKETATNRDIKIRSRKASQSQGRRKVLH